MDEDYRDSSSVGTPLTPLSPKLWPRHPSDVLKTHRCTYKDCDKAFNRPAKLAQHLRSHTNTRPFLCSHALCTKDFLRESHLKHHVKSAHSDVRDYVCEWEGCGKRFVTATRLKRHCAAHEGREKFRCTIAGCGQSFRKHGTLQKHILIVHEGKKPFTCDNLDSNRIECGAGFDTEGQLKSHAGRAHETNTFFCTICPPEGRSTIGNQIPDQGQASFSTHTALREHIEIEHPPTCMECGQKCKSLQDLKSHLEVIHEGFDVHDPKVHVCYQQGCGRAFTKKGNLGMHIQISHNPNRFVCRRIDLSTLSQVTNWTGMNSCGKALTTKAALEEHIRTAHQGLAPSPKAQRQTKHGISDGSARGRGMSILTRLTGADYGEDSGRNISCLVMGCHRRFVREYDLEIHLQSCHGLAGLGVQEMLMGQEELYSQQTLQGLTTFATKQDVDAEQGLDMRFDDDIGGIGHEQTLGAEPSRGGDSWLEEQSYQDRENSDEWLRDELEMRYLINGSLTMEKDEMG